MFKDNDEYSQARNQGEEWGTPSLSFFEHWVLKNIWVKFSIENIEGGFTVEPFFLVFLTKCLSKCLSSMKPPMPWKISGCVPALRHCSFCQTFHFKSMTVFWICLCFDNYSVICTVTLCYVLHQTHSEFWHIQHCSFSGIC